MYQKGFPLAITFPYFLQNMLGTFADLLQNTSPSSYGVVVDIVTKERIGVPMGIMTLFADAGEKKQPPGNLGDAIVHAELALTMIFRDIAAENNNLFIPGSVCVINQTQHHGTIVASAKKLTQSLQNLNAMLEQQNASNNQTDIGGVRLALEEIIACYQKNRASLADVLCICSTIKTSLEKIRPGM